MHPEGIHCGDDLIGLYGPPGGAVVAGFGAGAVRRQFNIG
jgi:hypothetical protein